MDAIMSDQACSCQCGKSTFSIQGQPFLRFTCHCSICQEVYQKPYGDATVLWANQVHLDNPSDIEYKKLRLPPALRRGLCIYCQRPVVGYFKLAPKIELAFVAAANYPKTESLILPSIHLFYNNRQVDIDDNEIKCNGYWSSLWGITAKIASRIIHNKNI